MKVGTRSWSSPGLIVDQPWFGRFILVSIVIVLLFCYYHVIGVTYL